MALNQNTLPLDLCTFFTIFVNYMWIVRKPIQRHKPIQSHWYFAAAFGGVLTALSILGPEYEKRQTKNKSL
jgi:hypothetical protein